MRDTRRFDRERRTMQAMIGIYCRGRHTSDRRGLCPSCADVLAYAQARLDKCLFPETKPTCASCPVHCYKPEMRSRVKEIMRYTGPRMVYRHPWLALRHYLDGRQDRGVTFEHPKRSTAQPSLPTPALDTTKVPPQAHPQTQSQAPSQAPAQHSSPASADGSGPRSGENSS